MSPRLVAILSAGVGLLFPCLASFGHHGSNTVYDLTQSITLSGTVTKFQFVNPHALIFFEVKGDDGEVVEWLAGMPSASFLAANEAWSKASLKPGDQVTITGAPARGGAASVWIEQVLRDGKPLLRAKYTG